MPFMLYALIGSILLGALSTLYVLWRKARGETDYKSMQKDLKATHIDYKNLRSEYNKLVESANEHIAKLEEEKKELLDALEKSGKPGVFADLLRERNAKT